MALIARLGEAIATADERTRTLLQEALAALVEDHGVIAAAERRKVKDRRRKRSVESVESAEIVESMETTESAEGADSVRPPAPSPSSSFPTPHITPSSPPPPETQNTAREREAQKIRASLDAPTLLLLEQLPAQLGTHWTEADTFLRTRAAHTWRAWVREFSKLLTSSHFVPGDLGQALADVLALDEPIAGPLPLRVFVERARKARLEHEQRDAQSTRRREYGTPSVTEVAAQRDRALVARDEEDGRQRAAAAEQWRREHPDEAAELDRALALQFPGDGPFVAMARDSAFVARVVDRAQRKAS